VVFQHPNQRGLYAPCGCGAFAGHVDDSEETQVRPPHRSEIPVSGGDFHEMPLLRQRNGTRLCSKRKKGVFYDRATQTIVFP
jgi:hypothetical protein